MNYPVPIEIAIPGFNLAGSVNRMNVFETVPTQVSHVIPTTTAAGILGSTWGVNLDWEISSQVAGAPHSPLLMPNQFQISVLLEGLGPGAIEFSLPAAAPFIVNYGPAGANPGGVFVSATVRAWGVSITFTPPVVTIPVGLYKLGVVMQLFIPGLAPTPLPVAGFVEGPLVQFFQPS